MKLKLSAALVAGCVLALSGGAAYAAMITEIIDFTARGFTPSGAPVDPVTGSFTITLDPTVLVQRATTVAFNNVNITQSAIAPMFDYIPDINGGFLTVCSTAAAVCPGPIPRSRGQGANLLETRGRDVLSDRAIEVS